MASKYAPLTPYLLQLPTNEWRPTFSQLEELLGFQLPNSARLYEEWWSNNPDNNVMTKAWLAAGFRTERLDLRSERVTFCRVPGMPTNPRFSSRRGVGDIAKEAILSGMTNEEALAAVKEALPDAETTIDSIASYRSRLRAERSDVPTDYDLRRRFETARFGARSEIGPATDDLSLIQSALNVLRGEDRPKAKELRQAILGVLSEPKSTGADIFASDLPDEAFDGVFDSERQIKWREVDL